MENENYKIYNIYYKEIPQIEIEDAIAKDYFIICNIKNEAFPLMNKVVYDPSINGIEKLRAIFRTLDDAITFVDSL